MSWPRRRCVHIVSRLRVVTVAYLPRNTPRESNRTAVALRGAAAAPPTTSAAAAPMTRKQPPRRARRGARERLLELLEGNRRAVVCLVRDLPRKLPIRILVDPRDVEVDQRGLPHVAAHDERGVVDRVGIDRSLANHVLHRLEALDLAAAAPRRRSAF